ncbi:MAG: T9SS type A sorting domain-containing protein [Chitinophagaceae bacterium]|nr:T9SS type A sorting domain-containing protein [Chitinophagaceae bacterium]
MQRSTLKMNRYSRLLSLAISFLTTSLLFTLQAQDVMKVQNGASITVQNGADMIVLGGITLDNGSSLVNNGSITLKQNGASGAANWTDNSATGYNHGTGKLVLNGNGGHYISSPNTFERIEVDASGHVTLGSNVQSNKWYLSNGKVNTSSFAAIALASSQLAVEAAAGNSNFANSWFNGNLRRYINPALVNNYVFPVGDATKSNRVVMDNLTANPLNNLTYIDASFGPKPGNDVGLVAAENGQGYVSVNNGGVWYLTPDVSPGSGTYDLQLYFNGFTGINDNSFGILRRPNASSSATDWSIPAGSNLPANNQPGRIVSSGFARRNGIGGFSQFGIANLSGPLPVTLLSFDARRLTKMNVVVNWETVTEINNKGFEVERRLDGEAGFTRIGFTPTKAIAGNSSSRIDYSYADANGFAGVSYYRLKQVDIDNRFTYTHIKAVKGMGETQVSVMLYPNPNYGQFTIRLDGVNRAYDAVITDMGGKTVRQLRLTNTSSVNITGLSAGTYIIRIPDVFGEGQAFTEKVLVVK